MFSTWKSYCSAPRALSVFVGAASISVCMAAYGAEHRNDLTLIAAIRHALATHPAISAAEANYEASEGRLQQAKARFLPNVRSGAEFGEGWRNDLDRQYLTVTASQLLYDFGQSGAQVAIERAERDVLYSDYQVEKNDLAVDVAEAYLEVIRHRLLISAIDEKLNRISEIEEVAETRLNLGGSDNADLVLTRSRYQSALAERVEVQSLMREWTQILSALTQTPVNQLDPNLSFISQLSCADSMDAASRSPYLVSSRKRIDSAQSTYEYAAKKQYPEISLEVGARQLLSSSQFEPRDRDYRIEIKFEMDLYNGGSTRAEARSRLRMIDSATMLAKATELDVSRRIKRTLSDIEFIDEKIGILETQRLAANDARDLFIEQYQTMGNRSLTDILNNEEEIAQVSIRIINANVDRSLAKLECASLIDNLAESITRVE